MLFWLPRPQGRNLWDQAVAPAVHPGCLPTLVIDFAVAGLVSAAAAVTLVVVAERASFCVGAETVPEGIVTTAVVVGQTTRAGWRFLVA